jgi:hypothetical protein
MRWSVLSVILASSLCTAASHCPDPTQRQAAINGESFIAGSVYPHGTLNGKPLKFAEVGIYSSSGQLAYVGKTNTDGWFTTGSLPPGIYRVVVRGWGKTAVRLSPESNNPFGGLGGAFELGFVENQCVLIVPLGGN